MTDPMRIELIRDAGMAMLGTTCIRALLDANDYSNKRQIFMAITSNVFAIVFAFLCIVVARA